MYKSLTLSVTATSRAFQTPLSCWGVSFLKERFQNFFRVSLITANKIISLWLVKHVIFILNCKCSPSLTTGLWKEVRRDWEGAIISSFTSTSLWSSDSLHYTCLLYSLVVAIVTFLFACSFLAFVDIGSLQKLEGLYPFSYNLTTKCVKMKAKAVDQILPNILLIRKEKHAHTHKWPLCPVLMAQRKPHCP